jgi:hypothetical protein
MFPLRESLSLSRTWTDEDEVVVISWFEWQRVHAESGYHEIDSYRAIWMLTSLDRHRVMEARHFVSELRLNSFPLDRTKDHEVLELIRQALNNRRLVAIQKGAEQPAIPSVTVQLRRLVAQVEKATHGKLSHQGRQYKLVVDVELASTPGRDYYEVASQSEARAALDSVAKISPASADLLKQASDKLTKDWYPPSQPDGLILLRRILTQSSVPKDTGSAITPSQMKRLLMGWLELFVVWADSGQPVAGVPLAVETSGNRQSLKTDAKGRIRLEDVEASCEVTSSFDGATIDDCLMVASVGSASVAAPTKHGATRDSAPFCIAAVEAHKVKGGETLASIAADAGMEWQKLAKFNWGTDSPKEINERLRDDVGCTRKTADGRNYLLDDTDNPGVIYVPSKWTQAFQPGQTYYIRVRRSKGILILLENEQGLRLPEVGYRVAFDDGTERTGQLGRNGMALVPAPSTGTFQVTYPDEVDILAKSLAACVRKGLDDRKTEQIFRLFTHDRPVVTRAVAAYDRYFNDYTGNGFTEDLYQEFTEPEALAVCEALMALHGLPTHSGVRVCSPSEEE